MRTPEWSNETFHVWLHERKGKQLYELQIDLCEWSIATPRALERLSADQREEFIQKVKKQIDTLKETQQPVTNKKRFDDSWYSGFSPERIKRLRDDYEHAERRTAPEGPPMPPAAKRAPEETRKESGDAPKPQ